MYVVTYKDLVFCVLMPFPAPTATIQTLIKGSGNICEQSHKDSATKN